MPTPEVPTFDDYFIPVLQVLADGGTKKQREIVEAASNLLGLTDEQRAQTVPSGEPMYLNRGNWAITHLNKAGAVESPKRAHWVITDVGRDLLQRHPNGIGFSDLKREMRGGQYDAFLAPNPVVPEVEETPLPEEIASLTPFELVESGQQRNEQMVREELLQRLQQSDPAFFEQAVLDLLIAMGYGGSLGKATRTQLSNDGGIDGVIDQDALGLSRIYVQRNATRYDGSENQKTLEGVSRSEQQLENLYFYYDNFETSVLMEDAQPGELSNVADPESELCVSTGLSPATIARMVEDDNATTEVLARICEAMAVSINDICKVAKEPTK